MRPISSIEELRSSTDDPLLLWAAQGFHEGVRAWVEGTGVAVAVAGLARRNRLAVTGSPADVASILDALLPSIPHEYRPIGDDSLVTSLCALVPKWTPSRPFGWMHTGSAHTGAAGDPRVELAGGTDDPTIEALLQEALPDSLARPGLPGVRRWWVLREGHSLCSCAADAWSAPSVGFLAGVATSPGMRGHGYASAVVGTALRALIDDYGGAGLMVEADNHAARRLYAGFGLSYRQVRAASRCSD